MSRARARKNDQPGDDQAAAYVLEDQVGFVLRKAHQRASEIFVQVMGRFDITPTQFAALAKIDDEGEVSLAALGRLTAMDPATAFGVVSRLRKRDLVTQRPDPADGRRVVLHLTKTGKALVTEMKAVAADVSRETLAPLTDAEGRTLVALLGRVQENGS